MTVKVKVLMSGAVYYEKEFEYGDDDKERVQKAYTGESDEWLPDETWDRDDSDLDIDTTDYELDDDAPDDDRQMLERWIEEAQSLN